LGPSFGGANALVAKGSRQDANPALGRCQIADAMLPEIIKMTVVL